MRQVVARQYIGQKVFSFGEHHREEMQQYLALSQPERDSIACIIGHIHYGVHRCWSDEVSDDATYITLLRDPIERTISSYYHILRNPKHPRYAHYQHMTLREYALKETRGERQTRWIYGFHTDGSIPGDDQPLPADALQIAQDHLRSHFRVVGLVEQFDASLLLMQQALGWKNVYYASRNVNEERPRRESVDSETLAVLHQHAEPDLSLYRFAQTLFQQQVARYGSDRLERDVRAFQRRNQLYGRVQGLRRWLRRG